MKNPHRLVHLLAAIGVVVTAGASAGVCAGVLGLGKESWKEEVLLHDGSKMVVTRSQTRGGRHEIGQEVPIAEHKLSFILPGTNETVTWEAPRDMDTNESILILLALDLIKGVPYLVTHPAGSVAYKKWGSPNPPYVLFKYVAKAWQRIPLEELPEEIKRANVVIGILTHARQLDSHSGIVSADEVSALNGEAQSSSVRYLLSFVRAPLDEWRPRIQHKGPKAPHPITQPPRAEGNR